MFILDPGPRGPRRENSQAWCLQAYLRRSESHWEAGSGTQTPEVHNPGEWLTLAAWEDLSGRPNQVLLELNASKDQLIPGTPEDISLSFLLELCETL